MNKFLNKYGLNAATLKWIAIILMLLNHLCIGINHEFSIDNYFINTAQLYLTRAAFIIFAFQIAEGMTYTHNKFKYISSLFIFALISEIPFDLISGGKIVDTSTSNVLWTLGLGAIAITIIEKYNKKIIPTILVSLITMMIAFSMNSDYGGLGVICVISFYYFNDKRWKQLLFTSLIFILFVFIEYIYLYYDAGLSLNLIFNQYWDNICYYAIIELHGLIAFPILLLYNSKKGKNINKWFFYAFYPSHLLLIYLICFIIKSLI